MKIKCILHFCQFILLGELYRAYFWMEGFCISGMGEDLNVLFSVFFFFNSSPSLVVKCPNLCQWHVTWMPQFKFLWHTTVHVWNGVLTWNAVLQKAPAYKCCQLPVSRLTSLQGTPGFSSFFEIVHDQVLHGGLTIHSQYTRFCNKLNPLPGSKEGEFSSGAFLIKWIRLFWLSGSDVAAWCREPAVNGLRWYLRRASSDRVRTQTN